MPANRRLADTRQRSAAPARLTDTRQELYRHGALAAGETSGSVKLLSQREREVLRLLADGLRNEDIGQRLHIAAETARAHIRNAMRKLGAATRTQAVATALRQSMIE